MMCPKCGKWGQATRHHVLPRRYFKKQKKPIIVLLCRECHDELEKKLAGSKDWSFDEFIFAASEFIGREILV